MLLRGGTTFFLHTIFHITCHLKLKILVNSSSKHFAPQNMWRNLLLPAARTAFSRTYLIHEVDTAIWHRNFCFTLFLSKSKAFFTILCRSLTIIPANMVILAPADPSRGGYFTLHTLCILTSKNCRLTLQRQMWLATPYSTDCACTSQYEEVLVCSLSRKLWNYVCCLLVPLLLLHSLWTGQLAGRTDNSCL